MRGKSDIEIDKIYENSIKHCTKQNSLICLAITQKVQTLTHLADSIKNIERKKDEQLSK
jgi:hypothetical protein